jgi:hypothetical protein
MEYNLPLSEVLEELERRYGVDEQTDDEVEYLNLLNELEHNQ